MRVLRAADAKDTLCLAAFVLARGIDLGIAKGWMDAGDCVDS